MLEHPIQKQILAESSKWPDVRLFRNNVGAYSIGGRFIRYGLHTGSGDLIGWKTVVITPRMVGRKVAVFTSLETKRTEGELSDAQKTWARSVGMSGGIAGVADCVGKARELLT